VNVTATTAEGCTCIVVEVDAEERATLLSFLARASVESGIGLDLSPGMFTSAEGRLVRELLKALQ